jgi:DNA-directed RNA polymerase subunit M/transcription elongation factor TFIIS
MVDCPECGTPVTVDDEDELDVSDVLECEECGALLKVTGVNPTEVKIEAEDDEEEEDFFDDDDDDSDDEEEEEEEAEEDF